MNYWVKHCIPVKCSMMWNGSTVANHKLYVEIKAQTQIFISKVMTTWPYCCIRCCFMFIFKAFAMCVAATPTWIHPDKADTRWEKEEVERLSEFLLNTTWQMPNLQEMESGDKTGKAKTQIFSHVVKGGDVIIFFSFMWLSYANIKERALLCGETHIFLLNVISSNLINISSPTRLAWRAPWLQALSFQAVHLSCLSVTRYVLRLSVHPILLISQEQIPPKFGLNVQLDWRMLLVKGHCDVIQELKC